MKTAFPPFVHSYPAPAVLIGCGTLAKPNLITISWFGTVCSEPPMISMAVRKSRYSYSWIHEQGEFTVNLPRAQDLAAAKFCGSASGRTVNKFEHLKLTPAPCPPLTDAPMLAEAFLSLGCRVQHELPLGSHNLFVAEVVSVFGEPSPDAATPRPLLNPTEQLVYLDHRYWTLNYLAERKS
jgi:flavin reductase (DIM6/NTAB) family NADH-FMN oxidoreductase RutF